MEITVEANMNISSRSTTNSFVFNTNDSPSFDSFHNLEATVSHSSQYNNGLFNSASSEYPGSSSHSDLAQQN